MESDANSAHHEEDEHDQSSYALVTSLFSKVENTLAAPLSSAAASAVTENIHHTPQNHVQTASSGSSVNRHSLFSVAASNPAPSLVSDTLDARSIRTTGSIWRSASVSKVIRRIRGEELSRDYWMNDELCTECYNCKSMFAAWRRKHHCRISRQIFCSRCASNIIKGARFGHNGMVRVCNLCLEKLTKVDDDDRRSINSSMTSPFAAHQLGEALLFLPFTASQLFRCTDEPFNLFSVVKTKIYPDSDDSALASPLSTFLDEIHRDLPFRRALTEEVQDSVAFPDKFTSENSPTAPGTKTPIDFPVTVPISAIGSMSSMQFPVTSPDQGHPFESSGMLRSCHVQSGIREHLTGHPGCRTWTESITYAQELNLITMFHLRIMLRQMLLAEDIPNIDDREEMLLKLSMRIACESTFTAHPQRQGADMDIPRGVSKDSEYVDGTVITKNITSKQIMQMQRNPHVMPVTFSMEFHRVEGQYMHFGQILQQEKDYLNNLATRISALRPHVVLAEKSVSGLALDALAKHKIAVVRIVKPSAIAFVARMTQGDVFSSMDKLALELHLGHCTGFRIQMFNHPLIPGHRKTYMHLGGCNLEMGCTIMLRGAREKKVTHFLAFIVCNLQLEPHLWKDCVITLPVLTPEATPPVQSSANLSALESDVSMPSQLTATDAEDTVPSNYEDAEEVHLSRHIQESIEPYRKTFLSVSAILHYPPPYPISCMKELDDELTQIKQEWEDEVICREEWGSSKHQQEATITQQSIMPTVTPDMDDVAAQIESLPLSEVLDMPISSDDGSTPAEHTRYFESLLALPHTAALSLPQTPSEELPVKMVTVEDIRLESRLNYLKWQHSEYCRVWEWYLRKNRDDFNVEKYQCISLWEITLPMTESGLHPACFPPHLRYITFYDAFAQLMDAKAICENKACNQPLAQHHTVYVHNESRLLVTVEQWDGQINQRSLPPDTIITWSICSICIQRYSFTKFLELHFYPADVQLVPGVGCQHNIYQHHIRCFAIQQMMIHFQADPVVLHEVVYPPMHLEIKNSDFERLHTRNNMWYTALIDNLKLINIDAATGDEEADAKLIIEINQLIIRGEWKKADIARLINTIYSETATTDTLALNQIRAYWQNKMVAWQQDFDKLPKLKVTQLLDRNSHKSSVFGSEIRALSLENAHNISEAEDYGRVIKRQLTGGSLMSTSSTSDAVESESVMDKTEQSALTEMAPSTIGDQLPMASCTELEPSLRSDVDSDSTIGATCAEQVSIELSVDHNVPDITHTLQRTSQLPRCLTNYPSVAKLVKKYQDYLPTQGVEELTKMALPPAALVCESEQETSADLPPPSAEQVSKLSISDFELSYAINDMPRYLTHARCMLCPMPYSARLPLPAIPFESRTTSRCASLDKCSAEPTVKKSPGLGSKVSNIAKHFKRISKDTEWAGHGYTCAKVEVLDSIKDAIQDESESSNSSEADNEGDGDDEMGKSPRQNQMEARQYSQPMNVPPQKVIAKVVEDAQPQGEERSISINGEPLQTLVPTISTPSSPMLMAMNHALILMAPITPELNQLPQSHICADVDADDLLADPEHIFCDSSMVSHAVKRQTRELKLTDGGEAFMPDDRSVAESTSTWGVMNVDSPETYDPMEELRVPLSKQPWAICERLFDVLHRTYDCEWSMVESRAQCVKWNASEGKSGSAFLKTLDDRFIAKELSRAELQAMETFVPAYFDYMSSAVVVNHPTLLTNIFECFKLTFRTSHKHSGPSRGKAMQINLLVMENLFYDHRFSKIYDLKGSIWNCHIQCTGRENEVLLDENLVETAHLAPFYLREHSKRNLRGALFNDSKFLAEINTMDYSLVVGVDSLKNELVIIDYIRTYMWDKKLESWVKDSAFLGRANRGELTIISPRQYRQHFLSAMEHYFPLVPDRWMKQYDAPEDESNTLLGLWPDW
ncbi:uncharacterized protein LAESUDRAFT_738031 [Laetiporus sulphureus 93-53]|uniref:1-phosphatidylinositol-3-phosphate 5-kinase n=1 Tax=Laetiporus sulphureus 93-53 TaxID=1314785 RepID=A0A165D397_9APHY|nr:uncharacterized protein LAESUDRAFT_738031 [Laetiporus sulphureus 93-53]KZT04073.1 hypothetical protein LAESUDRAFT_738031 [Laetiporus sulphureus 93-53]